TSLLHLHAEHSILSFLLPSKPLQRGLSINSASKTQDLMLKMREGQLILTRSFDRSNRHKARPFQRLRRIGRCQALPLGGRSEEHTSELQSRENLVCRLLLDN